MDRRAHTAGAQPGTRSAIAGLPHTPRVLLLDIARLLEDALEGVLRREGFEVLRLGRQVADLSAAIDHAEADALLVGSDGPAAGQLWSLLVERPDLRAVVLAGDGRLLLLPLGEASLSALVHALRGVMGEAAAP